MGLTNVPATFQVLVNSILRKYLNKFVIAYLDNILIYSETLEEHKGHIKKVLEALCGARLVAKPKKCEFYIQEVYFLGYIITPGKIGMEKKKVQAILEWLEPKTVKKV